MKSDTQIPWRMVSATVDDLEMVMTLAREFYRDFEFPWDADRKRRVLKEILGGTEAARVWLTWDAAGVSGYALVTYFLSLEFDGRVAVLDEFYVEPRCRGMGVGGWVLEEVARRLAGEGIGVIRLELDERHPEAGRLYARHGFRREPRQIWSRALDQADAVR